MSNVKQQLLAAIEGLCFADCVQFFAASEDHPAVERARRHQRDGELEFDDVVVLSEPDIEHGEQADGVYAMAWLWVQLRDE